MKKYLVVLAAMLMLGGQAFAEEMKSGDMLMKSDAGMAKKGPTKKDFVMMKGGKMMMMKDGKKMAMGSDMNMPNGNMVMKDGTIMMKDGNKAMMKEGDMMDMNGDMMKHKKTTKNKAM